MASAPTPTSDSVPTSFAPASAQAPSKSSTSVTNTQTETTTTTHASVVISTALPTRTGPLTLPAPMPSILAVTSGFNGFTTAVDVVTYIPDLSSVPLTPAAACNNTYLTYGPRMDGTTTLPDTTFFLYGAGCDGEEVGFQTSCLPNGALPVSRASINVSPNVLVETHAVFSPAAGCPVGYESACTLGRLQAASTKSGDSAMVCCPQGFQCGTSDGYCSKQLATGNVVHATLCSAGQTYMTITDDTFHVRAAPLYIVQPAATTTGAGPLPSGGSDGSSGSMSPALQAAIGVSVSLGVILLSLLAFLGFRLHRRKRQAKPEADGDNEKGGQSDAKKEDTLHEAHGETRRIEADAERQIYELPGSCLPEFPEDSFSPMEVAGKEVEKTTTTSTATAATAAADWKESTLTLTSPVHAPSPVISSPTDTPGSTLDSATAGTLRSTATGRRFSF